MTDRTPADYAIEHGEYLAAGAQHLINAINALHYAMEMEYPNGEIDAAKESLDDARGALVVHIYEFRKRRLRALATPAPAQPDPLHVANERGEGWLPIETAPDGVLILCCNMKAMEMRGVMFVDWVVEGKCCGNRFNVATHWMQLPAFPAAPKEKP